LNGSVFDPLDLDRPLPVDPGDVMLEVTAPEHERWEARLEVRPGPSNAVIDIPRLIAFVGAAEPAASGARATRRDDVPRAASARGFTTWAIVLGAVGAAGVGTGVYLGLDAVHTADRSRERRNCPLDDRCYAEGIALRDDARSRAHLADVVTGAGAALMLGGIILYLVAPDEPASNEPEALSLAIGPGEASVRVGGQF
jgi:serine/threonine-protein kinase